MLKNLEHIRHSLAHVLAAAVLEMFPKAQLGVGPVIENGFFYDFLIPRPFTPEDLKKLENRMRSMVREGLPFERQEMTASAAKAFFKKRGQPFKVELIKDIEKFGTTKADDILNSDRRAETSGRKAAAQKKNLKVSLYKTGTFIDLCRGGHVLNTREIAPDSFTLDRTSGAYWRGNEKNLQMQRIYGIAFASKEELQAHLAMLEEAKKRDHRKLGKELGIFMIDELVGKGLPIWLPNGAILKNAIEKLAAEMEDKYGYARVSTPHIAKEELFKMSGHLPYYADSMYPPMKMDDGVYYLKAMNCPLHHLIYKSEPRSYRDLPVRLAEYGTVYRNELSGTLAGLLRVRMLSMNDAHIYCTKDQIETEIKNVLMLTLEYFSMFGLKDYWFRLSKWDPKKKAKYINEPENWRYAEGILRKVLKELDVKFTEAEGEAAFYGPKMDVQFRSVIGREETMSTIQLDFSAKKRFKLAYTDSDGKENNDVFVVHRAPLSTMERFTAFLLEHYAGALPAWLSPIQARVLPIGEKVAPYGKKIFDRLKERGIRADFPDTNESLGKRIREAELQKIPYVAVVGEKEEMAGTVAVRARGASGKKDEVMGIDQFIEKLTGEIESKAA